MVRLARTGRYQPHELNDIARLVEANQQEFIEAWYAYKDGRLLSCPLAWFPRLLHGTPAERNHYELNGDENVIHWPQLDED